MYLSYGLLFLSLASLGLGQNFGFPSLPRANVPQVNLPQVNVPDVSQLAGGISNLVNQAASFIPNGPKAKLEEYLNNAWDGFSTKFGKVYKTAEEAIFRREIFIENMNKINRLNEAFSTGASTFVQRLNNFADMLHHEFDTKLNGFNRTSSTEKPVKEVPEGSTYIPSANVQIPDSIDWREKGAVTPVKSQGLCGGCYAFSAAGAIEGHYFRKTGVLNELSPQNLIDCTQPYGNDGCLGGLMDPAFQYVKDNKGIDTLASYPFEAKNDTCRYKTEGYGAEDSGFMDIPPGDESSLKVAVATLGPVSAAIDASRDSLQFYADGVYFDPGCKNETENMNHAILIVGYGTDPDGKEYWLIKNSYGTEWGNGGYMKLARNANNHCGIANIASFPLV